MNIIETINSVIILVGIPAVLAAMVQIGRRFQILDDLQRDMRGVKYELKQLGERMTRLEVRVTQIEVKLDVIWQRLFNTKSNVTEP